MRGEALANPSGSVWFPLTQHSTLQKAPPLRIDSAEGCVLRDHDGNEYLDALSGLWCVNVGYGRREMADAAAEQMSRLPYLAPTMSHQPGAELAERLLRELRMDGHVYFAASGSEANEAAFKIARQYHLQAGNPGRYKIISRYRGYHGNTLAAMAATGQAERQSGYGPMPPGFVHVAAPYPYRGYGETPEQHGEMLIRQFEETIAFEGEESVAAFIMEPIISGGGVLVPPDNYLEGVRSVCDRHGVLLIMDEVVTGFGRTGSMFGHHHWTAAPDIVTMAKGIASGYMPMSAIAVDARIFDAFLGRPGDLSHFRHINTYGAHPVAAAVALKNLEILEREALVGRARSMGAYLHAQGGALAGLPLVGEVRGKGMLMGIELVSDKATKRPLASATVSAVVGHCRQQGVLVGKNGNTVPGLDNVLIIAPPLVAGELEVDRIVEAIGGGLEAVSA